jgi:ketosteroid isomerase-like protein
VRPPEEIIMSDNVANIRSGFAAFAAGDLDTLKGLFDSQIVWHEPGRSSVAGDYRGIDETLSFFMQLFERSGGTFKAELLECGEIAPDLVSCLINVKGEMAAGSMDQRAMILFQQRSGRSIEVWNFSIDQYAQDEAWGTLAVTLPDTQKAATPVAT